MMQLTKGKSTMNMITFIAPEGIVNPEFGSSSISIPVDSVLAIDSEIAKGTRVWFRFADEVHHCFSIGTINDITERLKHIGETNQKI